MGAFGDRSKPPFFVSPFRRFLEWAVAQGDSPGSPLAGLRFSVFGLGSRAYARFCAAAEIAHAAMRAAGKTLKS
jgi:sulfite reductase alpha subunit-like flavoprotein